MSGKVLDVRKVGFINNMKGDDRTPETFCLPACLTSLMEYIGEDVRWKTITAHGREWQKRRLIDGILAASGMGFGLLWHDEGCMSCLDLMQVHHHDDTIRYAYDYMGYGCEIMERNDTNFEEMKKCITASINNGIPVLVFGIVGPPECGIICGYENGGDTLLGWSHFQHYFPASTAENGMFKADNWHQGIWKIVLTGEKKAPDNDLKDIIRRGLAIMKADELSGYHAGNAAYDKWIAYVSDSTYGDMDDDTLRGKHQLHDHLVGNHAEARCYLGGFLHDQAGDDQLLHDAAQCFNEIHDTCWKVWGALGGLGSPDSFQGLRDSQKRNEVAALLNSIRELDMRAAAILADWAV